jgi:hypothetical protein
VANGKLRSSHGVRGLYQWFEFKSGDVMIERPLQLSPVLTASVQFFDSLQWRSCCAHPPRFVICRLCWREREFALCMAGHSYTC